MALKVGTEDKKKVYLATGLGLVMLILLVRFLWQTFGPSPAAPAAPPPVVTVARPGAYKRRNTAGEYDGPGLWPPGGKGGRLSLA